MNAIRQRPFVVEALTVVALIAAPFVLPHLGFTSTTINRILVWGLFGLGFDILFGFTGLLSFGQSAFFGSGGMIAAYLLTVANFSNVTVSVFVGMIGAAVIGYLVGLIALRRTGIYFAMITVAIAEVFFFVEFNPLSHWTGGENGLPGLPTPSLALGFTTLNFSSDWQVYQYLAFWYFVGIVVALRIVRSPVGRILSAIRDNPLRAAAVGHNIHGYKLTAFVIAAAYAGFAGGLLGLMQGFMPPDAFTFDTSGQLVMQTAIGGVGTLFGPLVGAAVWFYLSDFLQTTLHLGATWKLHLGATWKLVLGLIFVLLVCFVRRGIVGELVVLWRLVIGRAKRREAAESDPSVVAAAAVAAAAAPTVMQFVPSTRRGPPVDGAETILRAEGITKRYGGLLANDRVDFTVRRGELRGIIGPNGAGKTTFFKILTSEIPPTSGEIRFEDRDITGFSVTQVCQLGLTKSYQINQLFNRLTVRENITVAALSGRGPFRLDFLRSLRSVRGLEERVIETMDLVRLTDRASFPVSELAYGEKRRLEIGLALATAPKLLLLDEPLAGLSPHERVQTVELMKSLNSGRTMVVIDHDMDAMFGLAQTITVLHQGRVLVEGRPEEIRRNSTVQEAYLGVSAAV